MVSLSKVFLRHTGAATDKFAALGGAALNEMLASVIAGARAQWPLLAVPDEVFLEYLARHLPGEDPVEAVKSVRAPDLFLACGCAQGDPAAMEAFEKKLLNPVAGYYATRMPDAGTADELKQALRVRLFVVTEGRTAPRITMYDGQFGLKAWLRTVAANVATSMIRPGAKAAHGDALDELRAPGPDPEINYLKQRYGGELSDAFRATLAELPERDAVVLRLYYLEGLNMDTIAGMFQVSRRTVLRNISQAKEGMFAKTRKYLVARLKLSDAEFETLMGLVRSQLDVDLADLLAPFKK